ncbi:MAG: ankyrin repeat domain-containing protein, partial [Treponema sp.]|nr:ankyrin repeat domain-containing protein [Treponema sp.]
MKCKILLTLAVLSVAGVFLLSFSGCKSSPKAEVSAEDDVWALLERGESAKARAFFLGKENVHAVDSRGRTPLHMAAEIKDPNLANFFISMGADVDAPDNQRRTPLAISAEKNDPEVGKVLAAAGADIHIPLKNGGSPALTAVAGNGVFLSSILTSASVDSVDPQGRTILHLAGIAGNAQGIDKILAVKNAAGKKDNDGKTALDLALARPDSRNHMEAAERLILAGGYSENPLFSCFAPAVRSSNYNIRTADGLTPLHYAAGAGYAGLITFLIEKKADVNAKSASGATPLHEAARSGNISVMESLIARGAEVNTQDAKGNSVLHIGIPPASHREAIALFLSHGANPNLRDEHGESPLHIAITLNRNPDVLQTLLGGGGDVSIRNIDGKTPLYLAVQESKVTFIPLLLAHGSDIFAADNGGVTPFDRALRDKSTSLNYLITEETIRQSDSAGNTILHAAVNNRSDVKIVGLILDKKVPVNARNKAGDTALHLAAALNSQENGELLLSRGADIFAPNAKGESPLYLAFVSSGGMRRWMINPLTLEARDGLGNSALHYLAQWKFDSSIPFLIQQGAKTEAANATGETPLFMAVKSDGASTVKTLLASRASLNSRDTLGNSALHAAVRWNAPHAAAALMDAGIDINSHSLSGNTPLHDAVRLGITELETLLIRRGADLEVRDADGNTPFMEAVMAGFPGSMERLANLGADPTTRNARGDTPLHIAVAMERSDMVNLLLLWGASIHARNARGRTPFQTALTVSP